MARPIMGYLWHVHREIQPLYGWLLNTFIECTLELPSQSVSCLRTLQSTHKVFLAVLALWLYRYYYTSILDGERSETRKVCCLPLVVPVWHFLVWWSDSVVTLSTMFLTFFTDFPPCFHIPYYSGFQTWMVWVLWNKSTTWSHGPLLPLDLNMALE